MTRTAKGLLLLTVLSALGAGCERREAPPQATSAQPKLAPSASRTQGTPSSAIIASSRPPTAEPEATCITPEGVGAIALAELTGEGAQEAAAVAAARRELKRVLENPEDFSGSVQTAGDLVLLELWHRSAFQPGTCDIVQALKNGEKPSTRCAKCRTLVYDPKLHRIVSTKVWEQADDAR